MLEQDNQHKNQPYLWDWRKTPEILRSPCCKSKAVENASGMECSKCNRLFPIAEGSLVLLDESQSLFDVSEIVSNKRKGTAPQGFLKTISSFIPGPTANFNASKRYSALNSLIEQADPFSRILVVGGGVMGKGMKSFPEGCETIETDIYLGPRTSIVCDAHDLPFNDGTMDVVIVQAVLEHVMDPYRCVSEIHRVLKENRLVYSETPFMQQVHEGRYDFTRFTHLGHRRLFRNFKEIESGPVGGPGTVLAWSVEHAFTSFAWDSKSRLLLKCLGRLCGFWFKYFDTIATKRRGLFDSASGYYFLGQRSSKPIEDRKLVQGYRGAQQ